MTTRGWCAAIGMDPPVLEAVVGHREANAYTLLIVALLERDEPMTLADVATRFEIAGVAPAEDALRSLQRCRPARAPVYRVDDRYHLDPHDDELDLWLFRLGLRPPRGPEVPRLVVVPAPVPGPEVRLTPAELDEAWKDASLHAWSARRLALAVLDASGRPLPPADVVAAVASRTKWHPLRPDDAKFRQRGSPVHVLEDGRWAIAPDAGSAVAQAREAVRERIAAAREQAASRPHPEVTKQIVAASEQRRAVHAAELAKQSRAILVAFPPERPEAVALLDVGRHEIATYVGDELAGLPERLAGYDVLGAVDVRVLLRAIGFDPGEARLAELGPPQKSKRLNRSGRTLKITTALLIQGSCGITKPFGDPDQLAAYLARGDLTRLRRRLEADAKSLHALYEYGRLHHCVRLRWGFLDERIPAPWVHRDEPGLFTLMRDARAKGRPLEVVVGAAPGWRDPWSRAELGYVQQGAEGWPTWLVDEDGHRIHEADVQRARLPAAPE